MNLSCSQDEQLGVYLRDFQKVYPNLVSAEVYEDLLWVNKPQFPGSFLLTTKNYHIADYNFFYADVRKNAQDSVKAYLSGIEMMDITAQRSHWKIYLAIAGISILLISLFYTTYLAQRLREGERNKASLLFYAYETINQQNNQESIDLEADLTLPLSIIESNKDIPIMWVDNDDHVLYGKNFGPDLDTNKVFLQEKLVKLKKKGPEPIAIRG